MDVKTIARDIEKGKLLPVYVCYGQEKYRMQEFISFLLKQTVEPDQRDFAISRYDLAETPLDAVLEDAQTLPFMSPRKVILAGSAGFLTAAKESGKIEHRVDRLLDYLKSPVDFSVIVFTADADKLDERKKIVKQLKESGSLLHFAMLTADELQQWVARRASQLGFAFERGALEQLLMNAGTHLQTLTSELEKLSLFLGAGGTATVELIDTMVVRSTEQNVFMLIEDIVQLRKDKALTILYELIKQKEEPIKIVMLMARQFRIVLQVKELDRQGYSHQQIAGQIGVHPYAVKLASEQARRYGFEQLSAILARLSELDYQMKSGKIDKSLGLELFILRLAA